MVISKQKKLCAQSSIPTTPEDELLSLLTEYRRIQDELQEREGQLRRITDNMHDMITQTDNEGIIQYISPSVTRTLGFAFNELIGKSIFELVHPDDIDETKHSFLPFIKGKGTGQSIFRSRCADNSYLWIESIGSLLFDEKQKIIGSIISTRDITECKQAELALRLSEERFYKAFKANPEPMCIFRAVTGEFIDVNDSFLRITGFTQEEILGRKATKLGILEREELHKLMKLFWQHNSVTNEQFTFRKKGGESRRGLASVERIDVAGEPCILFLMTDTTEQVRLRKEMARLDRLNLVGEMAAGIGHEIRNPMTTARGFLQLLKDKQECRLYTDYFDLIIEELDRANSIITEFLTMAKNKRITLNMQNLNLIINALIPLIRADASISDKLVKTKLQDIPDLLLDEKEIRQLILNLVLNGLEAMPSGGLLTIGTFLENGQVVLAVTDHGHGIKPELIEKLGTPFMTTKENGTGLGLAICYSIASRHNAAIDIKTGQQGTTFFIRFTPPPIS